MYKQSPNYDRLVIKSFLVLFHCLELETNGGWISSWPAEASLTYNVLLVLSLFLIVFKENVF